MDFDDADSVQETQTLELSETDLDGKSIINLRFVKFQNVSSVVVSRYLLGLTLHTARGGTCH
jgi:PITH domain